MDSKFSETYEQDFYDFSYGFRPGRSCHQALKRVGEIINFKPINHVWLKTLKNTLSLKELWTQLISKLRGYYQYYGVSENIRKLQEFYYRVEGIAFKLLNRRCHKKSFNWQGFCKYLQRFPLPKSYIVHNFYA